MRDEDFSRPESIHTADRDSRPPGSYEPPRIAWRESFGPDGTLAIGCGKVIPFQAEACAAGPLTS